MVDILLLLRILFWRKVSLWTKVRYCGMTPYSKIGNLILALLHTRNGVCQQWRWCVNTHSLLFMVSDEMNVVSPVLPVGLNRQYSTAMMVNPLNQTLSTLCKLQIYRNILGYYNVNRHTHRNQSSSVFVITTIEKFKLLFAIKTERVAVSICGRGCKQTEICR
jgi:hypothetical protein